MKNFTHGTAMLHLPQIKTQMLSALLRRSLLASAQTLHRARPNRADRGLWGGAIKQYGNNNPKFGHRTRRTWDPNVHRKRLWSDVLQRFVRINVTSRVLRWMDKVGGLDNYLLKTRDDKIDSIKGNKIKLEILRKLEKKANATAATVSVSEIKQE